MSTPARIELTSRRAAEYWTPIRRLCLHALPILLVLLAGSCGRDERSVADDEAAQTAALAARLEALGYLGGKVEAPTEVGVVHHDAARAQPGRNLYVSSHAPEAILTDMDGRVLHRWRHDFGTAWREARFGKRNAWMLAWTRAHLLPTGAVLAIHSGKGLVKVDAASALVWHWEGEAHHDLDVLADGSIYVLANESRMVPGRDAKEPVLDDVIVVLGPDGEERRRVSLLDCLARSADPDLEATLPPGGDLFHANTLEVLDGSLADRLPAFRRGNVLVSLLMPSTLAVVDLDRRAIVWTLRGDFEFQHHPTVLGNGHLLLFDNLGDRFHGPHAETLPPSRQAAWLRIAFSQGRHQTRPEAWRSAVEEIDPVTGRETWAYRGTPERRFYSATLGSSHRLPNGNTLITESEFGRAFEVTPAGETVWEFVNPHRWPGDESLAAVIYDLHRLPPGPPVDR